jgi:hypothetical protein
MASWHALSRLVGGLPFALVRQFQHTGGPAARHTDTENRGTFVPRVAVHLYPPAGAVDRPRRRLGQVADAYTATRQMRQPRHADTL